MMRRFLAGIFSLALSVSVAFGQASNNYIVPTAPAGNSSNRSASTAFVQSAIAAMTTTCPANQWVDVITPTAITCAQPAFTNLSGSLGCTQTPTLSGDVTNSGCAVTIGAAAVTSGKIASGAASSNVGTLGGVLSGTLPNPSFASGVLPGTFWRISQLFAQAGGGTSTSSMDLYADAAILYNPVTKTTSQPITSGISALNASIATGPGAGLRDAGGTSTVTITIATPAVISWTAHAQVPGNQLKFTTSGALPTGLVAGTTYYISTAGFGANSFQVADTRAHALAGTNSITTTGTQSGTQTATVGFYDQSQTVYFYLIWGSGPGIKTLNSPYAPFAINGNGTTGPILPSGYTHYALAFPVAIGTATSSGNTYPSLWWNVTGGLYSKLRVRGHTARFTQSLLRTPATGTACCTTEDYSDVIPTYFTSTSVEFDAEFNTSAASGIFAAGLLVGWNTPGEEDLNISVYGNVAPATGILPWANTLVSDIPSAVVYLQWSVITGTLPANFNYASFIRGYSWAD